MPYSATLSRDHPGFVLFMLDQSTSMNEPALGTPAPKKDVLATSVNDALYNLLIMCNKADELRHYLDVAVLGYSGPERSEPVLTSMIPKGAEGEYVRAIPDLLDASVRTERDQSGVNRPVWVLPVADGWTPMCGALQKAGRIISDWVKEHPRSFPPLIVNVTDGNMTDGTAADVKSLSDKIHQVHTDDGGALLFNVHLATARSDRGSTPPSAVFPASPTQLPPNDPFAMTLWDSSSLLPDVLRANAASSNLPAEPGARLFAFGATPAVLGKVLNFGTTILEPH